MFTIKYKFSIERPTLNENIIQADDMILRYDLFQGSIYLQSNETTITIDWDWVPIFDFALFLVHIYKKLLITENGKEILDFTESGETMTFARNYEDIEVITSFSGEKMNIKFIDFKNGLNKFYFELVRDLTDKYPALKDNPAFIRHLDEMEEL